MRLSGVPNMYYYVTHFSKAFLLTKPFKDFQGLSKTFKLVISLRDYSLCNAINPYNMAANRNVFNDLKLQPLYTNCIRLKLSCNFFV